MNSTYDLSGRIFGRITVLKMSADRRDGQRCWECRCDCGTETIVRSRDLRTGHTKSCGCDLREKRAAGTLHHIHGGKGTPEYKTWKNIKGRCYDPRNKSFCYYGAKGVTVAAEWLHDFPAFLAHIGKRPSDDHSIDRKNPHGNYEPGNVRWATDVEQANNHRRHHAQG